MEVREKVNEREKEKKRQKGEKGEIDKEREGGEGWREGK